MSSPVAAIIQLTSTKDIDANFNTCALLIGEAKKTGATIAALPENFAFMPEHEGESLAIAESLEGPLLKRYISLAKQHHMWLSLGGFPEKSHLPHKFFNSHLIINPEGIICAVYRKINLFSLHTDDGPNHQESTTVLPGNQIVTCETPLGKLGLSICFDLRFANLYQSLAKLGAEVLLVPAAFTHYTGKAHWEVLLRARAIENQCYVIAAAQHGVHNPKRTTYGRSMIIDPWGTILAECSDGPSITTAPIDRAKVDQIRKSMPVVSSF